MNSEAENKPRLSCKNCGDVMLYTPSANWDMYCSKDECRKAAVQAVMDKVRGPNKVLIGQDYLEQDELD